MTTPDNPTTDASDEPNGDRPAGYKVVARAMHRDGLGALRTGAVVASTISTRPTLADAIGELLHTVNATGPAPTEQQPPAITEQVIDAYGRAYDAVWQADAPITQGDAVTTYRRAVRAGLEAALPLLPAPATRVAVRAEDLEVSGVDLRAVTTKHVEQAAWDAVPVDGGTQPAEAREPWTFTRREGEPFTLTDAVWQALGGASSCWEHLDQAGVFDAGKAKEIGDALLLEIRNVRDADAAASRLPCDPGNTVAELLDALRLTVEYVGTATLPPIEGWTWFDALRKFAPNVADEFVEQHRLIREEQTERDQAAHDGHRGVPAVAAEVRRAATGLDLALRGMNLPPIAHTRLQALLEGTAALAVRTRDVHESLRVAERERDSLARRLGIRFAELEQVRGERDERLTLEESSRLARRYDNAVYDRDREHAKAVAYLLWRDHTAAALDNLIKAVERNIAGEDQPTDLIAEVGRVRKVLNADEDAYGQDIPAARKPDDDESPAAGLIPPEQLASSSRTRARAARLAAKQRPTLCRVVRYVGKQGIHATRAAVVSCTVYELDPAGDAPALDTDMHVHLFVTTPSERGFFVEFNVPYDPDGAPGTWHWPARTVGEGFGVGPVVHTGAGIVYGPGQVPPLPPGVRTLMVMPDGEVRTW